MVRESNRRQPFQGCLPKQLSGSELSYSTDDKGPKDKPFNMFVGAFRL